MLKEAIAVRDAWAAAGKTVAMATVTRTWGSSPWPTGSRFLVSGDGETHGSVSGGCVEEDLRLRALRVLETGTPEIVSYGVSNEDAFEVGLACGGTIESLVQLWETAVLAAAGALVATGRRGAMATAVAGADLGLTALFDHTGALVEGRDPPGAAAAAVTSVFEGGKPLTIEVDDGGAWFIQPVLPPPRLIVLGAIAAADSLVPMAAAAGFAVHVIDTRAWLADAARFPEADSVRCGTPADMLREVGIDSATSIVSFLHEPRLEDEVLVEALQSTARYVGSMGSSKNTDAKLRRLTTAGVEAGRLDELRAPIGLSIGSRTPQEMAVAVLAEVVAVGRGSI